MNSKLIIILAILLNAGFVRATAVDLNNKTITNIQVDPDYRAHGAKISVSNSDGSGPVDVCLDLNDGPDVKKAMLSVALTALTTGNTVRIWYDNLADNFLSWYTPGWCYKIMTITINK